MPHYASLSKYSFIEAYMQLCYIIGYMQKCLELIDIIKLVSTSPAYLRNVHLVGELKILV